MKNIIKRFFLTGQIKKLETALACKFTKEQINYIYLDGDLEDIANKDERDTAFVLKLILIEESVSIRYNILIQSHIKIFKHTREHLQKWGFKVCDILY